MKPARLLFFSTSFTYGGAERHTLNLIKHLDENRFSIGLIYLDDVDPLKVNLVEKDLFICRCLRRTGKFDLSVIHQVTRMLKELSVDLLICVEQYPLLYACLSKYISRSGSTKIAVILHQLAPPNGIWNNLKNFLYRFLINSIDKVFFVCQAQADHWVTQLQVNRSISIVMHNGVDASVFSPDRFSFSDLFDIRQECYFSGDDIIFGICARFSPEKSHSDFIRGIHRARTSNPRIKGILIGDGPRREEIENLIRHMGLSTAFHITGFVNDVRPYLAICDALILCSHSETFSLSALESMAMAKPLIMTDIGGAREQILDGRTGFLYKCGDVEHLADIMLWIATHTDKKKRIGSNAQAYLKAHYSLQAMINGYTQQFLAMI